MPATFTYTKPIVELIAEDIVAALANVTRVNGYHVDVESVERTTREGVVVLDKKAYVMQGTPEPFPAQPVTHEDFYQPYAIWYFAIEPDGSSVPIDVRLNIIHADIKKHLLIDYHRVATDPYSEDNWDTPPYSNGLAVDTLVDPAPSYIEDQNSQLVGVIVECRCHVRHLYGDPFSR